MPKLLIIFNRMVIGGASHVVSTLVKELHGMFEIRLVLGRPGKDEMLATDLLDSLPVKPVYIHSLERDIDWWNDWKAYREIKAVIRKFQPDIVHTHGSKPGALGRIAAHQLKVPVMVHTFHGHVFHSYFSPFKTRFYIMLERWLAKFSTRLIALSNHQKKELAEKYRIAPLEKIEVIPIGIQLNSFFDNQESKRKRFRNQYGLEEGRIAVGIIGRLVPIKNHIMFLDAFALARSKTAFPMTAFIVGDGEMRNELESYAKSKELKIADATKEMSDGDVVFTSWQKKVDWVYAGLDIVCLTSLNEGTPVSVIEAQAAGKPVVSTVCGGINDVVRDGETVFLTPAKDIEYFARRLQELTENATLRKEMGLKGRQWAIHQNSPEKMAEETKKLFVELLKAPELCRAENEEKVFISKAEKSLTS